MSVKSSHTKSVKVTDSVSVAESENSHRNMASSQIYEDFVKTSKQLIAIKMMEISKNDYASSQISKQDKIMDEVCQRALIELSNSDIMSMMISSVKNNQIKPKQLPSHLDPKLSLSTKHQMDFESRKNFGISVDLSLVGQNVESFSIKSESCPSLEVTSNKKKRKKKSKSKKVSDGSQIEPVDISSEFCKVKLSSNLPVAKPRNFLEIALYFSTISRNTLNMANKLSLDAFFAPPLLVKIPSFFNSFDDLVTDKKYSESLLEAFATCKGLEYDKIKLFQRRLTAIFAVILRTTTNVINPNNTQNCNMNLAEYNSVCIHDTAMDGFQSHSSSMTSPAQFLKSNHLKRSIGIFAVSLVDHLPPSMSCNLFDIESGPKNMSIPKRLGLDDLRVPSLDQLGKFWLGLDSSDKVYIIKEEIESLLKCTLGMRKSWCMCKYCKHKRLRLADIIDLIYRAYQEELESTLETLSGQIQHAYSNVASHTLHQSKLRRILYQAISIVSNDILSSQSHILLDSLNRLGKSFQDDESCLIDCFKLSSEKRSAKNCFKSASRCKEPAESDCNSDGLDFEYVSSDLDDCFEEYADESNDTVLPPSLDLDNSFSELAENDFYSDFNYLEDDQYLSAEADLPIEDFQLPSSMPIFYDFQWNSDSFPKISKNQCVSNSSLISITAPPRLELIHQGESLFYLLVNQIFQFHLVPAFLENQALERQRKLLAEEEAAEKAAKEREAMKILAKQRRKERNKELKQKLFKVSDYLNPECTDEIAGDYTSCTMGSDLTISEKKIDPDEFLLAKNYPEVTTEFNDKLACSLSSAICQTDDEKTNLPQETTAIFNPLSEFEKITEDIGEDCEYYADLPPGLSASARSKYNDIEEDRPPGLYSINFDNFDVKNSYRSETRELTQKESTSSHLNPLDVTKCDVDFSQTQIESSNLDVTTIVSNRKTGFSTKCSSSRFQSKSISFCGSLFSTPLFPSVGPKVDFKY